MIRTPDQRLRVFVSSTLQELADERVAARAAIEQLHLVPVMFELTVLFAGVATFVFVLARSGLRPGRKPERTIARTTDDRFALVVGREARSPEWPELHELLRHHGAVATWEETP